MMKPLNIIFLLIFVVLAECFAQTKSKYEKKVDSLTQVGQQQKIIPYLESEIKKQPKNEGLLRLTGFQYLQINNLILGEKYYQDALLANPKCARCYLNIGRIYARKKELSKALIYLNKAAEIDPKDGLILSNRGKIKELSGDNLGALTDHNQAISIDPKNSEYYTERGIYNLNQNYSALALSDFNKAIELAPNGFYAFMYRSNLNFKNGNYDHALKDINKAITLNGGQYYLYNSRGAVYGKLNDYEKAQTDYSNAIKLNPDDFLGYLNRAEINYQLENLDASCQDYTRAKALFEKEGIEDHELTKSINESILDFCDPSKPSYYYQRGVAFYNLKRYDKAIATYTEGLQKFPKNAMILSFKGNAYLALKDYKKANESYALALANKENLIADLEKNPRFKNATKSEISTFFNASVASIYFNDAECEIYNEDFDSALKQMNEAISLAPSTAEFNKETYYNRRGQIYSIMKKYDLAIVDFNKGIELNKNFALTYVNRAIAKVSATEKIKKTDTNISTKLPNQPFRIGWIARSKPSSRQSDPNIISALNDCNKGIELDQTQSFSYYIRGQIKQILGYTDYCIDLLKAKKMGMEIEESLLTGCN